MKKVKKLKCETISFEEFIDCITDGRGKMIKEELKKLSTKNKR